MKLLVHKATGSFSLIPDPRYDPQVQFIATPSAEDLAVTGPRKWVPDDVNDPTGPGKVVATEPVPVFRKVGKREFIERLGALGKWDEFSVLLAQLPSFVQAIWDAVNTLAEDDSIFIQNAPAIRQAMGLTDDDYDYLWTGVILT